MKDLEKYLNSIGSIGSIQRLQAIAYLGLGERSEAAKRVVFKRGCVVELMQKGLSFESAILVFNNEQKQTDDIL